MEQGQGVQRSWRAPLRAGGQWQLGNKDASDGEPMSPVPKGQGQWRWEALPRRWRGQSGGHTPSCLVPGLSGEWAAGGVLRGGQARLGSLRRRRPGGCVRGVTELEAKAGQEAWNAGDG